MTKRKDYFYTGNPLDDAFAAASEANRTGRNVEMNGITYHPDKPSDPWEKAGIVFLSLVTVFLCLFFGFGFYVLIRMV